MTTSILIATADPSAQEKLVELMGVESEGREIITSYDGDDALVKIRTSKPSLVLLDVSLPRISGYELCKIIKDSPQFANIAVVLLAPEKKIDFDERYRVRADAHVTWPTADPHLARNKLLHFLIKGRSGTVLSSQTLITLDVMAHRAAGILSEELVNRIDFSAFGEVASDDNAGKFLSLLFADLIPKQFMSRDFTEALSIRLWGELPPTIWTEIGEHLIRDRRCFISEFGNFDVTGSGDAMRIGFKAEPALAGNALPRLEVEDRASRFTASTIRRVIGRTLKQELFPYLMQTRSGDVLRLAIGPVLQQLLHDPEVLGSASKSALPWTGLGRRADLLGVLGQAAAYGTYFTFVATFGQSLHETSKIEIKTFGAFTRTRGAIQFEPAEAFRELLRANLARGRTAFA